MNAELPDLAALYARQDTADAIWHNERRHTDLSIPYEVMNAEQAHYAAQEPAVFDAGNRPKPGTVILDRDGDGWVFGRSRWTQVSGNNDKFLRVPGVMPWTQYGPYRIVGRRHPGDRPSEWVYRTIRPRQR